MSAYLKAEEKVKAIEKRASELTKGTLAQRLTLHQMMLLYLLYKKDCQRPTDLARALELAPTGFTPILDRLEILSLIDRVPEIRDRRAVNIVLTATAKHSSLANTIADVLAIIEAEFS